MTNHERVRVAVNGYGVIGKRVADAVAGQEDMTLSGVADIAADWRIAVARRKGYPVFAGTSEAAERMARAGLAPAGTLDELLEIADVVVDCTPKGVASENVSRYRSRGLRFIVQGGEKHGLTGHSFCAESNYETAVGRESTRVVSCNTSSVVRTLSALKRAGLLVQARGTLLRRATDPWESHLGGIMNTLVPEPSIPSHQGPDARTVDPDLDVVTMAVKVPETLGHLHFWVVHLTRPCSRDELLDAFRTSRRITLVRDDEGLGAVNSVKEFMLDLGRPHGDLYEVLLWEDMLTVDGQEAFYAYMVDNQAIVIPETVDAIRALTASERDAAASILRTDDALGVGLRYRGGIPPTKE
jgi:glyceraldehyde-3-phosphate dehydrogenase (NAD(P))